MIPLRKQIGKKIGIYGMGITGMSVLCAAYGFASEILCGDDIVNNKIFQEKIAVDKNFLGLDISQMHITSLESDAWKNLEMIVLSPGISNNHPVIQLAHQYNIPIYSDIDLLYEEYPDLEYIGITGTNGKSTTVALLGHLLGEDFEIGGNIGIPCLYLNIPKRGFVLELSSYQLDLISKLRLNYGTITNITPDHLERYGSFENYIQSKQKIINISNIVVLNPKDPVLMRIIENWSHVDVELCLADCDEINRACLPDSLEGDHNIENAAIALKIVKLLGIESNKLSDFKGLPHRRELLQSLDYNGNKIRFCNDSKATNVESALKSIGSFSEKIYLLAGGISKIGDDLSRINEYVNNIHALYLFGRDKEKFPPEILHIYFDDLQQAFFSALTDAKKSNRDAVILLAPACASTDQFKNFEERGDVFRKLVTSLEIYNEVVTK